MVLPCAIGGVDPEGKSPQVMSDALVTAVDGHAGFMRHLQPISNG